MLLRDRILLLVESERSGDRKTLEEELEWFSSDDQEPVSFRFVCDNLDIPYGRLRDIVLSGDSCKRAELATVLKAVKF